MSLYLLTLVLAPPWVYIMPRNPYSSQILNPEMPPPPPQNCPKIGEISLQKGNFSPNSLFFPEILQKSPYLIFLNSLIKLVELYIINKICSLTWSKDYNKIRLNILPDITWQHVVCSPGPCCGWGTRYDTRSRWTSSLQFSVWSRQAADAPGLLRVKWLEMNGQLGSLRRICISW